MFDCARVREFFEIVDEDKVNLLALVTQLVSNRVSGLLMRLLVGDEKKVQERKQVQLLLKQVVSDKLMVRDCILAQGRQAVTTSTGP